MNINNRPSHSLIGCDVDIDSIALVSENVCVSNTVVYPPLAAAFLENVHHCLSYTLGADVSGSQSTCPDSSHLQFHRPILIKLR